MKIVFAGALLLVVAGVAAAAVAYEHDAATKARGQVKVAAIAYASTQAKLAAVQAKLAAVQAKLAEAQAAAAQARAKAAAAEAQATSSVPGDGNGDGVYDSHPGQQAYDETQPAPGDTIDGPNNCAALRILNETEQTIESDRAYHACLGN